ncbi:MAG: polymerase alpha subunit, partial [Thermoleophilia bacterium]|nr:polymerase alpha subunit [Thermoleophilia bacterium]
LTCLTGCARRGLLVHDVAAGRIEHALQTLRRLQASFGEDDVYVELQLPRHQGDVTRNRALCRLAEQSRTPVVATGNVHAHTRLRGRLHEALVAIRLNTSLEACEIERAGNLALVMEAPAKMAERFADYPEAVRNTRRIAERIEFDLTEPLGYQYPGSNREPGRLRASGQRAGGQRAHPGMLPDGDGAIGELAAMCRQRLEVRYAGMATLDTARARLEEELRLVEMHGLARFFLLHHEVLELAREVALDVRGRDSARAFNPPGRGRGSSVESIICYLTGLSHIDPLQHNLSLGRFLNEDLISVPDIDLDFPRDIRHELLRRVFEHFGTDRCAMVAAHATYRARGAIRDLGAALGLPPGELRRIAHSGERHGTQNIAELVEGTGPRWRAFAALAQEIGGLPRQIGLHSGGVVIATEALCDLVPLQPAATAGRQLCQWDKDSCDDAGFLKIDVLGLGMLSSVEECVETISIREGRPLDLSRIPYDDPEVFAQIQDGDTVGTFQIESRAQITSIQRVRPENLADLTVQVAIIRPGPVVGQSVNPYITAREWLRSGGDPERIDYGHSSLRGVLGDTHGAIIFQDQVIEVAMAYAGFTAGEADGLRRAMTRKRSADALEAFRTRFVERAAALHDDVDAAHAEAMFNKLIGFSHYGFPRAHSAAFALLAYQSAWLRHHYGAHWYAALLNAQPMGFYPANALLGDAKRHGIQALGVDINMSEPLCTVEGDDIRLGLAFLDGLNHGEATRLVELRRAGGPFEDLADFARRAPLRRDQLERIIAAGATESFGSPRRAQLWQLGTVARPDGAQEPLELEPPPAPELAQLSMWEEVVADFASTGMSARTHPMELLRGVLPNSVLTTTQVTEAREGQVVETAGILIAVQRPGTAKGVMFALLEDEHGTVNAVFHPKLGKRLRPRLTGERILRITGRVERRHGILSLQASDATVLPPQARRDVNAIPQGRQFC